MAKESPIRNRQVVSLSKCQHSEIGVNGRITQCRYTFTNMAPHRDQRIWNANNQIIILTNTKTSSSVDSIFCCASVRCWWISKCSSLSWPKCQRSTNMYIRKTLKYLKGEFISCCAPTEQSHSENSYWLPKDRFFKLLVMAILYWIYVNLLEWFWNNLHFISMICLVWAKECLKY